MGRIRLAGLIEELERLLAEHPYQAPEARERAYNAGYVHGLNRAIAAAKNAPFLENEEKNNG